MSEDPKQVAEMIRNGSYFEQARQWYQALYIGPIAERTYFLIVACLSAMIAVFSVTAVSGLMPLTSKPGLLLNSPRPDEIVPTLKQIAPHGKALNQALLEFFVKQYVISRETYTAKDYEMNFNFVLNHSDVPTANAFESTYGPSNPRSPVAILADRGERRVTIESVQAYSDRAVVVFSTDLTGVSSGAKSRWTATMQYLYTDLKATFETNPKDGSEVMKTQDPQFQVTNYVLTQL